MVKQLTLAFVLVSLAACGGSSATSKVDYSVSAKLNFENGQAKLKDKDWIAAAKYFSFIKARFPYSKFAVLAELGLSDAEFGATHYLQAIDSYKLFIKFHPTHEKTVNGYAAYRIGESYFKMLPSDWWLLPPSHEKDQSASIDAHRELTNFRKKYKKSPFIEDAGKILTQINLRLAEHELYVARFYMKRGKPMGTVLRLRRLLEKHRGTSLDGEALYLLGSAYKSVADSQKNPTTRTQWLERARKTWRRLVDELPQNSRAGDAKSALNGLPG